MTDLVKGELHLIRSFRKVCVNTSTGRVKEWLLFNSCVCAHLTAVVSIYVCHSLLLSAVVRSACHVTALGTLGLREAACAAATQPTCRSALGRGINRVFRGGAVDLDLDLTQLGQAYVQFIITHFHGICEMQLSS